MAELSHGFALGLCFTLFKWTIMGPPTKITGEKGAQLFF